MLVAVPPAVVMAISPFFAAGVTRKFRLLVNLRLGVVTSTLPVVAPLGTAVVISVLETT